MPASLRGRGGWDTRLAFLTRGAHAEKCGGRSLQTANQAFATLRDGNESTRNREAAFKALERGSATYTELLTRLKDGLQVSIPSSR